MRHTPPSVVDWPCVSPYTDRMQSQRDAERKTSVLRDKLFEHLVLCRGLITYKTAYACLVGRPPPKFGSFHVSKPITAAMRSKIVPVEGLNIRLDALIVANSTREPGNGHFKAADYSRAQWRKVFGCWPICDHLPPDVCSP